MLVFSTIFSLLYSNSDWNGAKGKKFSQSVMERHFLKEVLCVRGWVWGTPLCVAAESQCSNRVPALMESDGSKSGRTEGSIGSVWTQLGWKMLNPKSIFPSLPRRNANKGWLQLSSCRQEVRLQKSCRSQRIDLLWRIVGGDSKSIYWSQKFVGGSERTSGWGGLS